MNNQPIKNPTPELVQSLIKHRSPGSVSLYLPIDVGPPASDKNIIQLRKLIKELNASWDIDHESHEGRKAILDTLQLLTSNPDQLLTDARTLAFFACQDQMITLALPYTTEALSRLGGRYCIKPLLPLLYENPTFTVLCLNLGSVQAYQGSRTQIQSIEIPNMPSKLEDITWADDPERSLQHHTSATNSAEGRPGKSPTHHIHGQGLPNELEEHQHRRFFRSIAKAVDNYLTRNDDPLILFGVERNVGLFRSLHDFKNREIFCEMHNAHGWDSKRVRDEAWKLLKPRSRELVDRKLEAIEAAEGNHECLHNISDCVEASANGRLDLVAIGRDTNVLGLIHRKNGTVSSETHQEGEQDLLDWIASETILNGGDVVAVDSSQIPGDTCIAASTRY
ncbi:MAG: hypothetical protein ACQKBT_09265 [Puniceicoccales bacterium]